MTKAGEERPPHLSQRTYLRLREMAMTYAFRPGERLNETELARSLDVSRTPLREAMHRLVSEGLLVLTAGRGFSARPLDVKEVFDLYEARLAIEMLTVRLACQRIEKKALEALETYLAHSISVQATAPVEMLLQLDEGFHEAIAKASANGELLSMLGALNRRIHFFRWIDMEGRRDATQADHKAILKAISEGNAEAAEAVMQPHIERRLDQIVEGIKEGHARIWTGDGLAKTNEGSRP